MANEIYFLALLNNHIGQTVTIFTTSGGDSGSGFTGVLVFVNCSFIRLITQIGPAPGCALGNCCNSMTPCQAVENTNLQNCSGFNFGSIIDIPVTSIAAFVHNAVGSN